MKKLIFFCIAVLYCTSAVSQVDSVTYGISAQTQGQGLYLSRLGLPDGNVVKISADAVDQVPAGNGRTIDPLFHVYYYASDSGLLAFDLNTGELIRKTRVINQVNSTFHGIHYNYRDSTLYGIAVDAAGLSVKLAKLDPYSGLVTPVSGDAVAASYSVLTGTALDPVHGIFYFETIKNPANHLVGVDLQTGEPVSDVAIGVDSGDRLGPIEYNCGDSTLYGLAGNFRQGRKLARIDPYNGVVTVISKLIVADTILNEQVTIDPFQKVFYFEAKFDGIHRTYRGVDINSGDLVVFSYITPLTDTYFTGFIYNHNCFVHSPSFIVENNMDPVLKIFPNPVSDMINIRSSFPVFEFEILDFTGKPVLAEKGHGSCEIRADLSGLPEGIYVVRIADERTSVSSKFVKTASGKQFGH